MSGVAHQPRIVAFLCNWCAYAAADRAGQQRLEMPQSLLTVRVMCTGRVEPGFVLQAFREGADGVLVAGCHPGECHYLDGNLRAAARGAVLARALEQAGIEPERFRMTWAGANEAERLAGEVREMTAALRALGPLDYPRRALDGAGLDAALAGAGPGAAAALPPRAPGKPRVAFYWNASCGGCEEAVVDLGDGFAGLLERVEVVLWPVATDHKRADVEALPDGGIDLAFVNGAVRLDEQEEWARLLRRKARTVVAFGACAHLGGVVGLGNLSEPEALLEAAYRAPPSVSNPEAPLPGGPVRADGATLSLPVLLPRTLTLADVVSVDYTIPGCPPSPAVVQAALDALLGDAPPPRGAVLAPDVSLCEDCPRKGSRPERIELHALRRLATSAVDPELCFLAQGLVCMGPATRQGCQPGCVEAGMPCRGCFGPLDGVRDGGAAMLSGFASLLGGADPAALGAAVPDPAGTFWRYSYAAALLPRRVRPAGPAGEGA
ncbi:Methyl-viologen-reducing hydrogenase, delta subunit [Anaeromyxobacter dehalogenans 2CP-C]|uniref:Methyl-viologen-reducing hydrogenase, delta subunit n=1 Tax=Anaeromyxobacter dehalogenans (strain 2CP-C) TaxID=290397 RepID=Q2IH66_ANADE|nr:Methyl-viologen-reducing hydrogenase, delta subunit [Anaeromyxobacter dehalogenans 2CP-C]